MDDRIPVLEQNQAKLVEKVERLEKRPFGPQKDFWDIVTATTPLITGILISGIGLYFAYTNNQAQLKLQETQTIEKFIPHLIGSEPEKKAAIIAISTITNTQTAAKYAELFASEGTASALKSIATSSNAKDSDRQVATKALVNTFHQMASSYEANQNNSAAEQAYEQAISEQEKLVGPDSSELIDNLNQLADAYKADHKYNLAEVSLKRLLKIEEKVNGTRSSQFIDVLTKLAQVNKLEGKNDIASHLADYANLLAKQLENNASADDNKTKTDVLAPGGDNSQNPGTSDNLAKDTNSQTQPGADISAKPDNNKNVENNIGQNADTSPKAIGNNSSNSSM